MRRILTATLSAALLLGIAGSAGARTTITPTITVNEASPAYQTYVTFTIVMDSHLDCYGYNHKTCARVEVNCSQAGVLVYGIAGDLEKARESGFYLDGGGGAPTDCVANLFYFDNHGPISEYVLLASTSFVAAGG